MMKFIDKIAQGLSYDESQVLGYSEEELKKIERLYDIKIKGDFRQFMLEMGRSDGGLICNDNIVLYRPGWRIREHILLQISLFDELQSIGKFEYLRGKTFIFAVEEETQYYFLRTDADNPTSIRVTHKGAEILSDDPNRVYYYDDNNGVVRDMMSFLEYMQATVRRARGEKTAHCGDLLVI